MNQKGEKKRAQTPISAIGRGFQISQRIIGNCLTLLIPIGIGYYIDTAWRTSPLFLLIGVFSGMIFGGVNLYFLVQFLQKSSQTSSDFKKSTNSPQESGHRLSLPPAKDHKNSAGDVEEDSDAEEVDPWEKRWEEKWGDNDE